MDATSFLSTLREHLTRHEHFRQDEHKLNEGSVSPWYTKSREGYTVRHGERWFALKWMIEELDGEQRASVLILPLSDRNQIAGPNQTATLRSQNEEQGNFFIRAVSNKPNRRASLEQAFGGNTGFPRYEYGRTWIGPIDDPEFLGMILDVAATSAVKEGEASRPAAFWAGGTNWEDTNMVEEFTSKNYWKLGWKADDPNSTAQDCWTFFRQVQVGDWFAMKGYGGKNDLRVYYVGRVTEVDPTAGELRLQREDVPLYRDKAPKVGDGGSWWISLTPVRSPEAIKQIFGVTITPPANSQAAPMSNALQSERPALNTILYGPPGTGKTYEAIARAVQIADGHLSENRDEVQQRFRTLCSAGRVAFITFHQSYSYEDFLEGIRPVLREEEERGARYELSNGIFKRIAIEAAFDCLEPMDETAAADFDSRWAALLMQIEEEPDRTYQGLSESTSFVFEVTPNGNIRARNVSGASTTMNLYCGRDQAHKVYRHYPDSDEVNSSQTLKVIGRGCHAHLIATVVQLLKSFSVIPQQRPAALIHADKAEILQRFLDRGEASGYRRKAPQECPPYVLLIDEINRGNISKIFGELITLLEPDKRLGAPVEIVATLPYSGERFVVPPNLYVVGTMNTADKSLALLDLALRRRFEFEELQPDFTAETCPCASLPDELRKLLEELNRRIALRKDRDHLIGHAYFNTVNDKAKFNRVFERCVIPLLQEYFFNDWDGVRAVLGENGTSNTDGFIRPIESGKTPWARNQWQWFHDCGAKVEYHDVLTRNYDFTLPTDAPTAAPPNH